MHKDKRIMNWQPFMNNVYNTPVSVSCKLWDVHSFTSQVLIDDIIYDAYFSVPKTCLQGICAGVGIHGRPPRNHPFI